MECQTILATYNPSNPVIYEYVSSPNLRNPAIHCPQIVLVPRRIAPCRMYPRNYHKCIIFPQSLNLFSMETVELFRNICLIGQSETLSPTLLVGVRCCVCSAIHNLTAPRLHLLLFLLYSYFKLVPKLRKLPGVFYEHKF